MAVINGTFLPDVLNGTADDDTINGFGSSDTLSGLDGNDLMVASIGGVGEVFDGGADIDTLTFGARATGVTAVLSAPIIALMDTSGSSARASATPPAS
jgi:Ca2+-binding RTX toxin-like protein